MFPTWGPREWGGIFPSPKLFVILKKTTSEMYVALTTFCWFCDFADSADFADIADSADFDDSADAI